MRPLCCDQPETLTLDYYPRVDSVAINAASRRRTVALVKQHYKTRTQKTDVGVSRAKRWAGGIDFFLSISYFIVLL